MLMLRFSMLRDAAMILMFQPITDTLIRFHYFHIYCCRFMRCCCRLLYVAASAAIDDGAAGDTASVFAMLQDASAMMRQSTMQKMLLPLLMSALDAATPDMLRACREASVTLMMS